MFTCDAVWTQTLSICLFVIKWVISSPTRTCIYLKSLFLSPSLSLPLYLSCFHYFTLPLPSPPSLFSLFSPHNPRMKKEMVSKVNAVAGEFRKVSDLQMAETTKRAIRENVAINQQLGRMSDKTMELLRENEALKVREKDLRWQVEVLEYNEKELAKKNINSQKVSRGGGGIIDSVDAEL